MKYYMIAGEASGDLHASHVMKALKEVDSEAQFRFLGGHLMERQGGTLVKHYRELAYMGFIPVLKHLRTILANMKRCCEDIRQWNPDVVILVDYPGFNLQVAKYVSTHTSIPVYYYIAPKIWAWKEYRIKDIRRYVRAMFVILPFEECYFREKHHYEVQYVGNPTHDEVSAFCAAYQETWEDFIATHRLERKPIIALLAGSRKQEIADNLPAMLEAASRFPDFQPVIACAPGIDAALYLPYVEGKRIGMVHDATYPLLRHATAALVTSGTATLETALFNVPQVVCYYTPCGRLVSFLKRRLLHVKYISLVNLIADKEVVQELVAHRMTVDGMVDELRRLLYDTDYRHTMCACYRQIVSQLGDGRSDLHAARQIFRMLSAEKGCGNQKS